MIQLITFTSCILESIEVQDGNFTLAIMDQARAAEPCRNFCDPCPAYAEHRCEEFMGHRDHSGVEAVVCHQKPARETLLNRVELVACGGLRTERHQARCKAQCYGSQRSAAIERRPAQISIQPLGCARHLNDDLLVCNVVAKKRRNPDHALSPDHPDLDHGTIRHNYQYRSDPLLDEVHV